MAVTMLVSYDTDADASGITWTCSSSQLAANGGAWVPTALLIWSAVFKWRLILSLVMHLHHDARLVMVG